MIYEATIFNPKNKEVIDCKEFDNKKEAKNFVEGKCYCIEKIDDTWLKSIN